MTKTDQWVQPLSQHDQAQIELVCFPFAGGGTMAYKPWVKWLPSQVNLSAVLLPGREIRIAQSPESDVDVICEAIITDLNTRYGNKPLVFFGHSMGTLLAYEVARRMQQQQNFLSAIIISGRQAPHLYLGGEFHRASDEEFIQELKRFGQTPDVVFEDTEMRNLFLPMLRADYTLLENYSLSDPPGQLQCPLLTCTGVDDSEVTPEQIQHWQVLVSGSAQHHIFDGDHFYLLNPTIQQQLVAYIRHFLLSICESD